MSGRRARWSGNRAVLKRLFGAVFAAYILYATVLVVLHPGLIYPFYEDDTVLDGFERVQIGSDTGVPIFVQERAGSGPVVLYFMGNAGSLSLFGVAFERHIEADRHIIALEYRGGAGRPGRASEAKLKQDALSATDYAASIGRPLIVQGFSLGTGLATHVAAERAVDRVILTAPYSQLCHLMAARSFVPACWLPFVQKWRSFDAAARIQAPVLVLHGAEDALIPPSHSEAFAALPRVERQIISGAGHNNIGGFADYGAAIEAFIKPLDGR